MSKITLSNCQQKAVTAYEDFLADQTIPYLVISGFAGSGKSFLVQHLADITDTLLDMHTIIDPKFEGYNLYFTTTTHKAADVLRNMLPWSKVSTIHSLLGLRPTKNLADGTQRLKPTKNSAKRRDLPNSIIFLDEASMVGRDLLSHIQDHMRTVKNCRYVFIGDPYQLPPVKEGICPIFREKTNHVFLNEIQRQVKGSPIIKLSTKYREILDDPEIDWPEITGDNKTIFYYDKEDDFRDAIEASMGVPHDSMQHKVLAWSNTKVRDYNKWIQSFQGDREDFEIDDIVMTNKTIMTGPHDDARILAQTDSLHTITDVQEADDQAVPGYYVWVKPEKDDIAYKSAGNVIKVFQPACWKQVNTMQRAFAKSKQWRDYFFIKAMWADLRPVHALTCHKAQGSTYEEVFVDLADIGRNTNWQDTARLSYVAVTRASKVLHIFGGVTTNYTTKSRNQMKEFDPNVLNIL